MSKRRRWLLSGGVLLSSILVALLFVLGSTTGTRWIYGLARSSLPEALTLENLGGSLLGGLSVGRLLWSADDVEVELTELFVDIAVWPLLNGTVDVRKIAASSVQVAGQSSDSGSDASGVPAWTSPIGVLIRDASFGGIDFRWNDFEQRLDSIRLSGGLQGQEITVDGLTLAGADISATLRGRGSIQPSLPLDASLEWNLRSSSGEAFVGNLTIAGDASEYSLSHELAEPFRVATDGSIFDALGDWRVAVRNAWSDVELAAGRSTLRSRSGRLEVEGNADSYTLDGVFDADVDPLGALDVRISAQGDSAGSRFDDIEVAGSAGRLEGTGTLSWTDGVEWDFSGSLKEVAAARLFERLEGVLSATGTVSGRVQSGQPLTVEARIADLRGEINGQSLTGSADVDIADSAVSALNASVSLGNSRLTVAGSISSRVELDADFELSDLSLLTPDASGSLTGNVSLSGPRDNPHVSAIASGADVTWARQDLQVLTLEVRGTRNTHEMKVEASNPRLAIAAAAAGGLDTEVWSGTLDALALTSPRWGSWTLEEATSLTVAADTARIEALCLRAADRAGSVCVEASIDPSAAAMLNVNSERVPLAVFSPWVSEGIDLSGTVTANGAFSMNAGRWSGRGEVSIGDGGISTDFDGEALAAEFSQAEIELALADNALSSSGLIAFNADRGRVDADLRIDDVLAASSSLSGSLNLGLDDLSLIPVFLPDVRDPQGRLSGSVELSGTRESPRLDGELRLVEGRASIEPAGVEVTDISASVRQSAAGGLTVDGSGTSGEGSFRVQGEIASTSEAWLTVEGNDVEVLRLPDQRLSASPDVRLTIAESRIELAGAIAVPTARLSLDRLPAGAVRSSPDVVVHGGQSAARSRQAVAIDLKATLGEDVAVSGFGLQTHVEGALDVSAREGGPLRGAGRLDLRDGEYEAFGQTLVIERGELVFNGPLERPQLDVRAVREAGSVTAGVNLTGTPDDLRSEVFSEPALSDAEALSYLLTGRPLSSASSSEGNTLNQAAFALGLSRAGAVTEQIRNTLGLETLAVEGGGDAGRIVAGKQLGGRLFVEYGYGLVDQLGTLLLRYQLNDRLVLETSSGAATTLDLVYSVKQQ